MNFYCASCGSRLRQYPANEPVYDFHSPECHERFQLKASKHPFGKTILDSEYRAAMRSLENDTYPSLILLNYNPLEWRVENLDLVHRACITASSIIKRKPLGPTARRGGWQGCLISLTSVPEIGRVNVIRNGRVRQQSEVLSQWKRSDKLLRFKPERRGWLADVLTCVEGMDQTFTLDNVYSFEDSLAEKHPKNHNVRAKIRQQLQVLRDSGFVEFVSPGRYRRI
jgi:type II restriction enzyme